MAITNSQQARQMYKEGSKEPVMQGGGPNYLGKQKEVTTPKKWKSSPEHPDTELAYITEPEKQVLIALNMHGGLEDGKPNKGPNGIISLQGDLGGYDASPGGPDSESGDGSGGRNDKAKAADIMTGKVNVTSPSGMQTQGYRGYQPNKQNKAGDFYGNPTFGDKLGRGLSTLFSNSLIGRIASKFGPINNKDFYNEKVVPAGKLNMDKYATYDDYMQARMAGEIDAYGNPISQDNDNDNNVLTAAQLLAQQQAAAQQSNTTDSVVDDVDPAIPYRLMNMGGDTEDAPLMAGAPELKLQGDVQPKQENMMMAEADPFLMDEYEKYVFDMEEMGLQPMTFEEFRREAMSGMAGGGIAGIRQGYIFGGIAKAAKKAVKGATRAVKKIAKSKIGKAALLAAGGYYLGGGNLFGLQRTGMSGFSFGNLPGATSFSNFFKAKGLPNLAKGQIGVDKFGNAIYNRATGNSLTSLLSGMSTPGKAALGIGALTALPLLGIGTGEEEEGEEDRGPGLDIAGIRRNPYLAMQRSGNPYRLMAEGGNAEPVAKDVMPLLDMDGKEKDYRETGGFVDMGRMEKADDVPARLSKNEFVFTADAVRNAGEGDIDKGAEVMYNMMKNLESGGEVSEDSQGLDGARAMFQTSQKLEGVL